MTKPFEVGDRVEVLLHERARGVRATVGGWVASWHRGTVVKVNRVTAQVKLDVYFFYDYHTLTFNRLRRISDIAQVLIDAAARLATSTEPEGFQEITEEDEKAVNQTLSSPKRLLTSEE